MGYSEDRKDISLAQSRDTEQGEVIVDKSTDVGLRYLAENGRIEYTANEEQAVRWKIDLFVLPIVSAKPDPININ